MKYSLLESKSNIRTCLRKLQADIQSSRLQSIPYRMCRTTRTAMQIHQGNRWRTRVCIIIPHKIFFPISPLHHLLLFSTPNHQFLAINHSNLLTASTQFSKTNMKILHANESALMGFSMDKLLQELREVKNLQSFQ